uniref:BET1-like protein n=6 Tax=Neoaves TaxID=3078114 RepID=A0A663ERH0_AQUCH
SLGDGRSGPGPRGWGRARARPRPARAGALRASGRRPSSPAGPSSGAGASARRVGAAPGRDRQPGPAAGGGEGRPASRGGEGSAVTFLSAAPASCLISWPRPSPERAPPPCARGAVAGPSRAAGSGRARPDRPEGSRYHPGAAAPRRGPRSPAAGGAGRRVVDILWRRGPARLRPARRGRWPPWRSGAEVRGRGSGGGAGRRVLCRCYLGGGPAADAWRGVRRNGELPPPFGQSPSAVEDMLDVENKRMADSLANKVTRLKSLALDIDKDADEQNRYLDGMDSDFMSVTGLLTGSVKRFSTMTRSGRDNRKLLCSVSAGLIVVFFILYYLVSKAGT